MKALVINRDRDTDRMAFQARQLAALGVACERLPAITPETLEPDPSDPYWDRWQRPLRAAEKALLASHRAAWQQVASGEVPVLVLEDDALLLAGTRGFWTGLRRSAASTWSIWRPGVGASWSAANLTGMCRCGGSGRTDRDRRHLCCGRRAPESFCVMWRAHPACLMP
jgi:hypothetical protein